MTKEPELGELTSSRHLRRRSPLAAAIPSPPRAAATRRSLPKHNPFGGFRTLSASAHTGGAAGMHSSTWTRQTHDRCGPRRQHAPPKGNAPHALDDIVVDCSRPEVAFSLRLPPSRRQQGATPVSSRSSPSREDQYPPGPEP